MFVFLLSFLVDMKKWCAVTLLLVLSTCKLSSVDNPCLDMWVVQFKY